MSALSYINITAEILCLSICLILLLCMSTAEYRNEKLNRIFISVVGCLMPLLIADMTIFIVEDSITPYRNVIFKTAYFLSFILGTVLLIAFTRYFLTFVKLKTTPSRATVIASNTAIGLSGVNILLIILTQFNGLYYYFDGDNLFRPGNWYLVSQSSAVLCIVINTGIMLANHKYFETREKIFLLSYTALPTLAIIVQNMVDGVIATIDVAATLTIVIFYAGIQSEQGKQLKEKEVELANSRIVIMLTQIQPHFLYNALGAIDKLYFKNVEEGHNALVTFSAYLRGNMDSIAAQKCIQFADELAHVKHYLWLEQLRFEENLRIIYDIQTGPFEIPALTLQPIVENAVRHGVTKKNDGGSVTIRTTEEPDQYRLEITDDGVGFDTEKRLEDGRSHIGIDNVRERLRIMCNGTLTVHSEPGKGTTAIITIPKREGN